MGFKRGFVTMHRNSSRNKNSSTVINSKMFNLPDGGILLLTRLHLQSRISPMLTRDQDTQPLYPETASSLRGLTRPSGLFSSDWTPPYKRCQLCRCPILETDGDFFLCNGCVTDQAYPISKILARKYPTQLNYRLNR